MTKITRKIFSILLVLSIVLTGQIFTSSFVFAANTDFTSDDYIMSVAYSPKLDLFAGVRKDKTVVMSSDGLNWYVLYQYDGLGQALTSSAPAGASITWLDKVEQFVVTNTMPSSGDSTNTQPYIYVFADDTDWKTIKTEVRNNDSTNNIRLLSIAYDGKKFWATGFDDAVSEYNNQNGTNRGELSNIFSCDLSIEAFNNLEDGDSMVWTKVAADTVGVRAGYKLDLTTQYKGICPLTNIVTDGKASNSTDSTIIAYSLSGYDADTEAIGRYGIAFRSTDSGATWSQIDMSSHYATATLMPKEPEKPQGLWVNSGDSIIGYSARGVLNSIYYDPYYDWFIAGFCRYLFILNNDGTAKPLAFVPDEEKYMCVLGTNEDATYVLAQFTHSSLPATRLYKLPNTGENTFEYFTNTANWKATSLTGAFNPYEYGLKRDYALKVKTDKNDSIIVGANHFLYSTDNVDNKKSAIRIDTANGNFIPMPSTYRGFSANANATTIPEDYLTNDKDITAFELSNMEILGNRMKYSLTKEPSTIEITGSASEVLLFGEDKTVTLTAEVQDQLGNAIAGYTPVLSLYGTVPEGVTLVGGTLTIPTTVPDDTNIKIRATVPNTKISSIYTIYAGSPIVKIEASASHVDLTGGDATVELSARVVDLEGNLLEQYTPVFAFDGEQPDGVTLDVKENTTGTLTIQNTVADSTAIKVKAYVPDTTVSSTYTITVSNALFKLGPTHADRYAYSVAYSPEEDIFVAAIKSALTTNHVANRGPVIVSKDGKTWYEPIKTPFVTNTKNLNSVANKAVYLDDTKSFVLLNGFYNNYANDGWYDSRGQSGEIYTSTTGLEWKKILTQQTTDISDTYADVFLSDMVYDGQGKFWAIGVDVSNRFQQGYVYYCEMTPDQFNAQADGSIMLWTKVKGAPANFVDGKSLPTIATRAAGTLPGANGADAQHNAFGGIVTNGKGGIIVYSPAAPHKISADSSFVWDRNGACFYTNDYGKTWNQLDLSYDAASENELNKVNSVVYNITYDKYFDKFISVAANAGEMFDIDTKTGTATRIPNDTADPWNFAYFINGGVTSGADNDRLWFVDQNQDTRIDKGDLTQKLISIPRTAEAKEKLYTDAQYTKAVTGYTVDVMGNKKSWAVKPTENGYIFVGASTRSTQFTPGLIRIEVDNSNPENVTEEYIDTYYIQKFPSLIEVSGASTVEALNNTTVNKTYTYGAIFDQLGDAITYSGDIVWSLANELEGVSINSATGELSVLPNTPGGIVNVVASAATGMLPRGEKEVVILPSKLSATKPVVTVDGLPIEAIVAGKTAIASTIVSNTSNITSDAIVLMALYEKNPSGNTLCRMSVGEPLKVTDGSVTPFEGTASATMIIPDEVTDNENNYFLKVFILSDLNNLILFNNSTATYFCNN